MCRFFYFTILKSEGGVATPSLRESRRATPLAGRARHTSTPRHQSSITIYQSPHASHDTPPRRLTGSPGSPRSPRARPRAPRVETYTRHSTHDHTVSDTTLATRAHTAHATRAHTAHATRHARRASVTLTKVCAHVSCVWYNPVGLHTPTNLTRVHRAANTNLTRVPGLAARSAPAARSALRSRHAADVPRPRTHRSKPEPEHP